MLGVNDFEIKPGLHPNSIAALERSRVLIQYQRQCVHCKRPALRGKPICQRHAGWRTQLAAKAGRGERRKLDTLDRLSLLPADLLRHPAWLALSSLPTSVRSPLRLAMVQMWDNDPLAFAQLVRRAFHAAATIPPVVGFTWRVF